ncbi:MAG: carbamoyltransferase, partial [bacterium]
MYILGISCYYHDAAACLLKDGVIIAAAQEERFTRKKHDPDLPVNAVAYCLKEAGIKINDLDYLGFYDKPFNKFERILQTYLATFPRSLPSFLKAIPVWLHQKLWIPQEIEKKLEYTGQILFAQHHQSHAASAFYASGYEEAAVLTLDGVGEWDTATYGIGRGSDLKLIKKIKFPHSLGLLYSAFTYYLGFKVNSAEYKVMGLAPYGEPKYVDLIKKELIHINDDGSFRMNMKYFAYDYGLTMTNRKFDRIFGGPPRKGETKIEQKQMDLAASVQKVTEEIVTKMACDLHRKTGQKNLCMAGGVALNCVANGKIIKETPYKEIFVQPAAGDAGGAYGVAAYIYHNVLKKERTPGITHSYFGPEFRGEEIRKYLEGNQVKYHFIEEQPELLQ